MIKLLETIRVENKKALHLNYHNRRLNSSRKKLFGLSKEIKIEDFIPTISDSKIYRLRVIYSKEIEKVELIPYQKKIPKTFRLVEFDGDYSFKYLNRDKFESLKRDNQDVDELILVKDGKLTDTTITNIALLIGNCWFTPKYPLLKGTTRERFLNNQTLKLKDLYPEDLKRAKRVAVLNAMIRFLVLDKFLIKD